MKKKNTAFANFETVCELARELPGAEESTSYGTPAFKVKGKLFARFHQDGESLVVGVDFDEREEMMKADPEKFYITDHYRNYPWILVRLSKARPDELRDLLLGSWRRAAPKQMVRALHKF
jgi:hypothetical protein